MGTEHLIEYQPADESGPTYVGGMAFVDDPVASAFVLELAPIQSLPLPEASGKRVELLREVAPTVARVAVLSHASLPSISVDVRETEAAAQKLGMPVHVVEVGRKSELDEAFAAIAQERATGVIVGPSMMLYLWRGHIARLALKHQLPAVTSVQAGCLMSYGPDLPDLARRAAYFMDKLFRGRRARRPAGGAADASRIHNQCEYREGPRSHHPALAAAASGSGD